MNRAWPRLAIAGIIALLGLIAFMRHRWLVLIVRGASMEPTLHSGDVIVCRRSNGSDVRAADIVVARSPQVTELVVKRVAALGQSHSQVCRATLVEPGTGSVRKLAAGEVFLVGDNLCESTDSRHWGPVAIDSIVAVQRLTLRIGRKRWGFESGRNPLTPPSKGGRVSRSTTSTV